MTLFYYETVGITGRWSPCTTPGEPATVYKGGHLREQRLSGVGNRIRCISAVAPEHRGLTLNQLATIYGAASANASAVTQTPCDDTAAGAP